MSAAGSARDAGRFRDHAACLLSRSGKSSRCHPSRQAPPPRASKGFSPLCRAASHKAHALPRPGPGAATPPRSSLRRVPGGAGHAFYPLLSSTHGDSCRRLIHADINRGLRRTPTHLPASPAVTARPALCVPSWREEAEGNIRAPCQRLSSSEPVAGLGVWRNSRGGAGRRTQTLDCAVHDL